MSGRAHMAKTDGWESSYDNMEDYLTSSLGGG